VDREEDEDTGITHVYCREIELGFGKNVVFWLDNNLFEEFNESKEWIRWASFNNFQQNVKFVCKTHSEFAVAYMRSEFFRISLIMCKRYKMI